jgi:hypothetical protein
MLPSTLQPFLDFIFLKIIDFILNPHVEKAKASEYNRQQNLCDISNVQE